MQAKPFAVCGYWRGEFDEPGLVAWAEALRACLDTPRVSLGLTFLTPQLFPYTTQILELLRVHAQVPLLVGCSSPSLIAGDEEIEEGLGLVLGLYHLPGATLTACHFTQRDVDQAADSGAAFWHQRTGVPVAQTNGWLVFADPYHLDGELWLRQWNEAYAPRPILGGLASGFLTDQRTQVYWNGTVYEEGAVAVSVGGGVELTGVISQGCTPIGDTWTITRATQNVIQQIGNRPAYEVLAETFDALPTADKQKCQGNLFVGLVVNEYLDEFQRGDFLIRNLLGADPRSGALAVGALPRAGQTLQFQRRDAAAAQADMRALLGQARVRLQDRHVYGGCLCSCNGRGQRLFGRPHHDARSVQQHLGPLGVSGFFCNGEIGPVGASNFLHGYTASLALFVEKQSASGPAAANS
jgi:small ligand-binding sensory domain FIST